VGRPHHRPAGPGPRALAGGSPPQPAPLSGGCGRYVGAMVHYGGDPEFRDPRGERGTGSLEQRLDRWVSAGRQLVDGVAGARPGSRPPARSGGLGRWLEDRVDWLLEDGDDWREPWQENQSAPLAPASATPLASSPAAPSSAAPSRRRSLEAISRRAPRATAPAAAPPPARESAPAPPSGADWPDDASFTVPRWQRPASAPLDDRAAPAPAPPTAPARSGRPLPRSTRRRS
jgi:hypothetical protein